jgi:putative transposase
MTDPPRDIAITHVPPCDRLHWARLLAFVTGLVNQELLLRNEYLIAENRILRSKLPNWLPLSDPDRAVLGEIAKRLGRAEG